MSQPNRARLSAPKDQPRAEAAWLRWLAHPAVAALLLVGVTLAVFWPVAGYDFINLDDFEYVSENPQVQNRLTWKGFLWAFGVGYASNWHPLTWLSHMLDVNLFGKAASGPHVVNVLFHAANAVLLFALLRKTTGAHWRSWLIAALFALHPLHVESVAWISERKDVLSTFFGLLCLLAYANYAREIGRENARAGESRGLLSLLGVRSRSPRSAAYYTLTLLWFVFSLMSKPMMVTLPFLLLVLDYWPLRRFEPADFRAGLRALLPLAREKAPFFLLTAAASAITLVAQARSLQPLASYSLAVRIENAFVACASYVGKSFWPVGLVVPYPHPGHWPVAKVGLSVLVLAGISAVVLRQWHRRPYLVTGALWFFGMLVPVIGLVQVGGQAMADRYMYLPQTGLWLVVVWAGAEAAARWRLSQSAVALALGLAMIACALRTRDQLGSWKNSETLFSHAVLVTPANPVAYHSLGLHYDAQHRPAEAIGCYSKAIQIDPDYAVARVNLGAVLAQQQRFEDANTQFREALRLAPRSPLVLNNVGVALVALGQLDQALEKYQEALHIAPGYAAARKNLGRVLLNLGRYEEAARQYSEAVRQAPDARSYNNLGYALAAVGKAREAADCYREAIRRDPALVEAYNNLGNALLREGATDEALEAYREALRLEPTNVLALNNVGFALATQKKYSDALSAFEAAVRQQPGFLAARLNLADALAAQGRLPEAEAECNEVLRLEPNNPKAHFCLGRLLPGLGRSNSAAAHLAEALRLRPDYPEAKQLLQKLKGETSSESRTNVQ